MCQQKNRQDFPAGLLFSIIQIFFFLRVLFAKFFKVFQHELLLTLFPTGIGREFHHQQHKKQSAGKTQIA